MNTATQSPGAAQLAAWDDELEQLYARLSGRGSFTWDAASDGLYRAARDNAVALGRLAMQDSMGQAAALTGGYGSSYAQRVGQQSYDDYLTRLGEAMPQFYAMARERWQDEGDALRDRYDLLYRRAEDARDRMAAEQAAAAEAEREAQKQRAEAEKAAAQQRQKSYDALVKLIQSSGYRPKDAELRAAGLTRAAADALAAAWSAKQKKSSRRGSSRAKKTTEAQADANNRLDPLDVLRHNAGGAA